MNRVKVIKRAFLATIFLFSLSAKRLQGQTSASGNANNGAGQAANNQSSKNNPNPATTANAPQAQAASSTDEAEKKKATRKKLEKALAAIQFSSDKMRDDFMKAQRQREKARRKQEMEKRTPQTPLNDSNAAIGGNG